MSREERVYKVGPKLRFTLNEDHLIEEGSRGVHHWRQAWALQQLSPEVESQTGRPHGTKERLMGGVTILAVAVIVYFSHYNANVPLLAPLLSVVGLIVMGRGLKTLRVETWTTIRKWDGTAATSFSHRDCNPGERAAFEEAFAETVRHIRRTRGADQ